MINIKNKTRMIFLIGILSLFLLLFAISNINAYSTSSYALTQGGMSSVRYMSNQGIDLYPIVDNEKCGAGQDLLLQISPTGCQPAVVRSDLLEEQNVALFCPIMATKINPLIDINTINSITLQKQSGSNLVQGVGFHPAQSAIAGAKTFVDSPILSNIGYAVIVLKQNKNESSMPDYVSGTIKATIRYDIESAFGTGKSLYYLPVISDEEWEEKYQQFGFWKGKGFLRAESVEGDSAIVSMYQDKDSRFSSVSLTEGEESEDIYVPGYYCAARMNLKLEKVEDYDTFVKISVNDDIFEVKEGESFLDNKCKIQKNGIKKVGLVEKVKIYCKDDGKGVTFELVNSPTLKLSITDSNGKTTTGNYNVGDRLYLSSGDSKKDVYLAGAYTKADSGKAKDLQIFLFQAPLQHEDKLTYDDIGCLKDSFDKSRTRTGTFVFDELGRGLRKYIRASCRVSKYALKGEKLMIEPLQYGEDKSYAGAKVSIIGFGDSEDEEINIEFEKALDKSLKEYKTLGQQFSDEEISSLTDSLEGFKTYSEKGAWEAQELAEFTDQHRTRVELLKEFIEKYPDSKYVEEATRLLSDSENSNSEINTMDVVIGGRTKKLTFNGIYEPSVEDYGATIIVENSKNDETPSLRKNEGYDVSDTEYFELLEVKEDSVIISVEGIEHNTKRNWPYNIKSLEIKQNGYQEVGDNKYKLTVGDINLKKVARVSVKPSFTYKGTETNFTYKIGIEKRAIQLSPEKIKSKIENLDKQLVKWSSISENLNTLTKNWKAACLTVGTYYTVKNFFSNAKGKSIARQYVMRSNGGWTNFCSKKVSEGEYSGSMDLCYYTNADEIDRDVDKVNSIIQIQQEKIKTLQSKSVKDKFLGEDVIDKDKLATDYIPSVKEELKKAGQTVTDGKNTINIGDIDSSLTVENFKTGNFDIEQLRDMQLNSMILDSSSGASQQLRTIAQKELYSTLNEVQIASKNFVAVTNLATKFNVDPSKIAFVTINKDTERITYEGQTLKDFPTVFGEDDIEFFGDAPVSLIQTSEGGNYIAVLDDSAGTNIFPILKQEEDLIIFDTNGYLVENPSAKLKNLYFQKYDSKDYENEYINPEIKYYEKVGYTTRPAIVPIDTKEGWYAATKQSAYDESARVTSLWLCNVGSNGRQEFDSGIRDDICQLIELDKMSVYQQFYELDPSKVTGLVNKAVNAVENAQRQYRSGVKSIDGVKVGEPSTSVPEVQCQDFMSPKDCYVLFNACDPVVCPSSRCNLGGAYTVPDVIQSGIVGSIALCLPNAKEKIIVPVCLSGLNAGVQGLVSMMGSYRDCLQTSLDTGQQVGICDEIHSIYLCEFFWRQAAPLSNQIIPKLLSLAAGQGTRGGGEYLSINSAWTNAQDSVNKYFKQYYGANAYQAFQIRSTTDVGSAFCKVYGSLSVGDGNFIDALIEPDSPVQYNAWFSEIPFTTSTNPPISQYKVFYRIYAGKDMAAYYRVYLKSPAGSSFYDVSSSVLVANGYLTEGETKIETKDFTAASGYRELCVSINDQDKCGFKEVSTSFLSTYVKDKYVQEEASKKGIKKESECVSGTSSLYSLLNPNLEEGVDEALNPDIFDLGIVRICATNDPGKGTDANAGGENARWQDVGYCDDGKIRCWLDTQSVKNAVSITSIENQTLSEVTDSYMDALSKEGGYLTEAKYQEEVKSLSESIGESIGKGSIEESELNTAINKIENIFSKAFFSNQKAELLGFKARAYNKLTYLIYNKFMINRPTTTGTTGTGTGTGTTGTTTKVKGETLNSNQIAIGDRLIEIAQAIKEKEKIDDSIVEKDTGVTNFECLILMLALHESSLNHCIAPIPVNDEIYCNNDLDKVIKSYDGTSYGIMQINLGAHPGVNVGNFEANANYGINLLNNNYNPEVKSYNCRGVNYAGWKRALRIYNGWNTKCDVTNDVLYYVENVLSESNKATIGKNFDVCSEMRVISEETTDSEKCGAAVDYSYSSSPGPQDSRSKDFLCRSGTASKPKLSSNEKIWEWTCDSEGCSSLEKGTTMVTKTWSAFSTEGLSKSNLVGKVQLSKKAGVANYDKMDSVDLSSDLTNLYLLIDKAFFEKTLQPMSDTDIKVEIQNLNTNNVMTIYDEKGLNIEKFYIPLDKNLFGNTKAGDSLKYKISAKRGTSYETVEGTILITDSKIASISQGGNKVEVENIKSATKCPNCGKGLTNVCDENECAAIGAQIGRTCIFEDKNILIPGGSCIEEISTTTPENLIGSVELYQIIKFGVDKKLDYITLPVGDNIALKINRDGGDNLKYPNSVLSYTVLIKDKTGKIVESITGKDSNLERVVGLDKEIFQDAKSRDKFTYEITAERDKYYDTTEGEIIIK